MAHTHKNTNLLLLISLINILFYSSCDFFFVSQGKVFPKLRKRSSAARLIDQDRNSEEQTAADYVFRIVYPGYRYDASKQFFCNGLLTGTVRPEAKAYALVAKIRHMVPPQIRNSWYNMQNTFSLTFMPLQIIWTQHGNVRENVSSKKAMKELWHCITSFNDYH